MPPTADAPPRAPRFRFRTLRGRLAFVFLSLIFVLQTLTFLLVFKASREHALRQIEARLGIGLSIFRTIEKQRVRELNNQARTLAYDYAFKQTFGASINDPPTMRLAMKNWRDRVGASFFVLVSLEGKTIFDSENAARDGAPFDLPELIAVAESAEDGEARGLTLRDGKPFAVVLVPLLAPDPEAWICLGFRIDDAFVKELGAVTRQAVSVIQQDGGWKIAATTHEPRESAALADALKSAPLVFDQSAHMRLGKTRYVSLLTPLDLKNGRAAVLLQRNLDAELAEYDGLALALIAVAIAGLALSAAAALAIARSVAQPVLQLAQDARRVELGDYAAHDGAGLERADEIGQLAQSFQKMTVGLAERDRVRDLLGKVASPAIAAELLRREASLGGEERTVTVLFSDLRDFSALSERLPASEVVAMLNTYFTRMSEIVDAHGGVVDKFIGDALMALFGAPVEQPDHAAHALDAALEMTAALDALNAQGFASEIVQLGIGIHTDTVVAGIMGSPARHNYTVIGDGVNIASRLQSLTRRAEYDTRIIISEATLRAAGPAYHTRSLGEAFVKGKAQPLTIHALIGRA